MYRIISQRYMQVFLLLCCVVSDIESTNIQQLYVATDCDSYSLHYVGEYDMYEVIWKNEELPATCKFKFKGRGGPDEDYQDEYKVCIKASVFDIRDCNVNVNYYFSSFDTKPAQTYSCNQLPSKICSRSSEFLYIELKDNTDINKLYPGSKFKFVVTAVKTYDHSDHVALIAGIIGGVVCFIALLVVIGVVFCICKYNRKRSSRKGGPFFHSRQSRQNRIAMASAVDTNTCQNFPMSAYPRQALTTQQYSLLQYPAL